MIDGPGGPLEIYWYDPDPAAGPRPALYHIHGGGMVIGSAKSMQHGPAGMAAALGIPVASVELKNPMTSIKGYTELLASGAVGQITEPRQPCFKFNAAMGFGQAAKLMVQSGYCGSYLAVIEPGTLCAGESIELQPGPREVSIRELFQTRYPRGRPDG